MIGIGQCRPIRARVICSTFLLSIPLQTHENSSIVTFEDVETSVRCNHVATIYKSNQGNQYSLQWRQQTYRRANIV
jgi:hypothetical protein